MHIKPNVRVADVDPMALPSASVPSTIPLEAVEEALEPKGTKELHFRIPSIMDCGSIARMASAQSLAVIGLS